MFLDYKGVLKKWEKNHNKCDRGFNKIDHVNFDIRLGFDWTNSPEGLEYWKNYDEEYRSLSRRSLLVGSLGYWIDHRIASELIIVGCQKITKEDALKIADFIYECFGEEV